MNIAIIGSGAIGTALVEYYKNLSHVHMIHWFSSKPQVDQVKVRTYQIDYPSETSVFACLPQLKRHGHLDLVIVATGILHDDLVSPEKALKDLNEQQMAHIFQANTWVPSLMAKYFIPLMCSQKQTVFAALSARVGSISDNRLGGWYSYRASKAALNMILRNIAIEVGRIRKQMIVVGLHPGTVDSPLSEPFQARVAKDHLFSPSQSAGYLADVISQLNPEDSGYFFGWDGQRIEY